MTDESYHHLSVDLLPRGSSVVPCASHVLFLLGLEFNPRRGTVLFNKGLITVDVLLMGQHRAWDCDVTL